MKEVTVIEAPKTCMNCRFIFSSFCEVDSANDKRCPFLRPSSETKEESGETE